MRKFEIPVTYAINTTFEVNAATLDAAIRAAQQSFFQMRPTELIELIQPEEVDKHSCKVDKDLAEEMNPKKTYSVKLVRTQEVTVEVEADTEDDAQDAAIALHEDGKVPENDWEETDLNTEDVEEEEFC